MSITHCLYGLRIATSVTLDLATVEISDSRSYGVNVTSTVTAPLNLQQINCTKGGDYGMLCAASNVTLTTCQASANVRGGFYISGDKTTLRQCVSDGNAADPKLGDGVGFDIFGNLCRLDKCEAKGNARDGVRIRNAQGTTITQGDYSTNGFDAIREVGRADGTTVRDIVATGYQSEAIVLSGGKSTVTGVQGSGQ